LTAVGVLSSGAQSGHNNIDGGLRDEDTYVIGDDDDVEETGEDGASKAEHLTLGETTTTDTGGARNAASPSERVTVDAAGKLKYYVQKGDTLQGIALKFGCNVSVSNYI
jgi:hypothetical protein